MQLASRQLLRALRAKRSQVAFARKLGYRGNPIADWEAGRRSPTIGEVVRACGVSGIDARAAFERFQPNHSLAGSEAFDAGAWLSALRGSTSTAALARRSGASRHQLTRWLKGTAQPRLPDFLRVVEAITGRVCELVAELVPIDQVPCLGDQHERLRVARHLAHDEPWTEAILRLLESEPYREQAQHCPGQIGQALAISIETEERCLEKLQHAGIIESRDSKFRCIGSLTVDTRAVSNLKAHWSQVATDRLSQPQPQDVSCYNVLSASEADLERIADLLVATYREIRTLVAHTPADEGAALVNLQLVRWRL